ncbi:MAG: 2,3-bisphosphoglycerate-independent phosphoglycerate mutase [Proteobacteria bacterium]|nr:2,3-bisphosphoglycerate-independent phosphoglycerate mutase [Pseudomonadota bacterium]MBU1965239.1 2,3-bisphosphoglycerate-independent phosphoglycerate mutase [Pseudomonadota bacterium]MBU4371122.1 2,3-bisphosphoglycerate-independent phosphoglycerate mutase [Pseudomonadota bacterium]
MRPVCLVIRDGWGYSEISEGNAVLAGRTPNSDLYRAQYPWTLLDCAGEPVGLPDGYQGSSEVGHLNMGAGRIVTQELKRIDDGLRTGELFNGETWEKLVNNWKKHGSRLHLLGLLQDEGVHAHQEHLFKIMRRARLEYPEGRIIIHPFLDGRDTPPRSCLEYLAKLSHVMETVGGCAIGTVMGRYYGMDRSWNWKLTDMAYHCIVACEGRNVANAEIAVRKSYAEDRTPDGAEMCDEYIYPHVISDHDGVRNGDCILHTNYRQDRAIQLTMAFADPKYPGSLRTKPAVTYVGLTRYWDEFTEYLLGAIDAGGAMKHLLGEVISRNGLRQLRIAETQKFRHVTSFFNGKSTTPYENEDQVDVPSRFDPATFASHPEMEAYNVTDELMKRLDDNPYHFIAVNFANGDMVGHTGDMGAAIRAIEIVDECQGRIVKRLLELDAHILITADHGNAEQMIDDQTGATKTSHSLNPVELIYVAGDSPGKRLVERGKLSDIAPTVLYLLGLEIPEEMTAQNLIVTNER